MSRLRALRAGRHDTVIAVVFAAFLALVAVDAGSGAGAPAGGPDSSARVTPGRPGLGELLVPTRPSAPARWAEPGSGKAGPALHAVVAAAAAVLVVLVAGLARRRPGPPWHHRRRHSAVLRAPPLLLHV